MLKEIKELGFFQNFLLFNFDDGLYFRYEKFVNVMNFDEVNIEMKFNDIE